MDQTNPYSIHAATPAALAAAEERASFLRKTYGLLLAGIFAFAVTLWASANVEPVRGWAEGLARAIYGSRFGWLLYIGLFLGGSFAVHAVAERKPINVIAFFAFTFLMGLLIAPLIMIAMQVKGAAAGVALINQAALLTALVFTGLTAWVFMSGKDFSFLRGILAVGFWSLLAVGLCGWIFGFSLGFWFSAAIVLLFVGYILYDTSNVLHHYPTTAYVAAACVLFVDVILLFKHVLILLLSRND